MNLHEIIYIQLYTFGSIYHENDIFYDVQARMEKNGWGGPRDDYLCWGRAIFGNLLCELISLLNKFEFSRTPPPGRSTHDAYV